MKNESTTIVKPRVPDDSRPGRRAFLNRVAIAATTGLFAGSSLKAAEEKPTPIDNPAAGTHREQQSYQIRVEAARRERDRPPIHHSSNGDESRYAKKFANYSKGLPHNSVGEVELPAWESMIRALSTGVSDDFEKIQMGGAGRLVNPQAGLAFDMQGADSHAVGMRPAPRFDSAEQAGEIGENYWMALTRDISFLEYVSNPLIGEAAADLSKFSDLRGPKAAGSVTPSVLFRGVSGGDVIGPYISQFFWKLTPFGSETIDRRMRTTAAFTDYMTTFSEWLAIQNGAPGHAASYDPIPRYIRNAAIWESGSISMFCSRRISRPCSFFSK